MANFALALISILFLILCSIFYIILQIRNEFRKFYENNRLYNDKITEKSFVNIEVKLLSLIENMGQVLQSQQNLSQTLYTTNQQNDFRFDAMRSVIDKQLYNIQEDNAKKLEQMRIVVEEKLQSTIEKRLRESFDSVSSRLEMVHRGLGEMHNLANSVVDLKGMLSNVKIRGIWGEVQLDAILNQIMAPSQYSKNIAINPKSNERVEFAIKLPCGQSHDNQIFRENNDTQFIYLPIDSKFPLSDYQKIFENPKDYEEDNSNIINNVGCNVNNHFEKSDENNNIAKNSKDFLKNTKKTLNYSKNIENSAKNLEQFIRKSAKSISEKYIIPPYTTDFAIMFIPVESIYAEILRRPGIIESIQNEYRIIIAGPTTLAAILNSLQMGFRTLAIAKRSNEIWGILDVLKKDFHDFTIVLSKAQVKIEQAGDSISLVTKRSKLMERKFLNLATDNNIIENNEDVDDIEAKNKDKNQ